MNEAFLVDSVSANGVQQQGRKLAPAQSPAEAKTVTAAMAPHLHLQHKYSTLVKTEQHASQLQLLLIWFGWSLWCRIGRFGRERWKAWSREKN
jgi:hypothetical protein